VGTCPQGYGSKGTLCLSLRTDCANASTQVASASIPNVDCTMPTTTGDVPFKIEKVPDGDLKLHAFLDKDASGCDAPTTNDLYLKVCIDVKVSGGQDVTGVKLLLDAIK
jgi:hypothetical protein